MLSALLMQIIDLKAIESFGATWKYYINLKATGKEKFQC
jgi:hypothetical protein